MSGLIHVDDVFAAEVMLPVLVHDVVPERFNLNSLCGLLAAAGQVWSAYELLLHNIFDL